MPNDDEREALRDEIAHWPIGSGYYRTSIGVDEAGELADAILAAGFRQGQITEAMVEAAREAYANEQGRQRDEQVGRLPNTIKGRTENARARMRAALEAAEEARRG